MGFAIRPDWRQLVKPVMLLVAASGVALLTEYLESRLLVLVAVGGAVVAISWVWWIFATFWDSGLVGFRIRHILRPSVRPLALGAVGLASGILADYGDTRRLQFSTGCIILALWWTHWNRWKASRRNR